MINSSMSVTELFIRTLTKAQRVALDRIATAIPPRCQTRTLVVLEHRGLIVGEQRSYPNAPNYKFIEYHVPVGVHVVWSRICSEEYDALSPEERVALEAPDL